MIEGVLKEIEPEGTIVAPSKAGRKMLRRRPGGSARTCCQEVLMDGGQEEDTHAENEHEEDAPVLHPEVGKLTRCMLR